jgi:TRAP-type C4-dicarboxylate transport system substrate-binding protein
MFLKRLERIGLIVTVLAMALVLSHGPAGAADKTYKLVIGHGEPPTVTSNPMWELMKEKLEKESNGRIQVRIHPSGSLCSEGTCVEQLRQKAIDMAHISSGNYGAFSNVFYVLDMPYLFDTFEAAKEAATGPIGDILKKRSEERDKIKCLAITSSYAFRNLYNNVRECRVPADTKGIKIRTVHSPIETNLVKGWGATPLNVPYAELYQACRPRWSTATISRTATPITASFMKWSITAPKSVGFSIFISS